MSTSSQRSASAARRPVRSLVASARSTAADAARRGTRRLATLSVLALLAAPARAHGGPGLGAGDVDAPAWLFMLVGGLVVAATVLLATVVTDRDLLAAYHERRVAVPGGEAVRRWGVPVGGAVGLLGLAAVVVGGVFGPPVAARNVAVLLVWVGWWAGFTASTYLLGNAWPALDPFGRLAAPLSGDGVVSLPDWLGRWPAVAGLLLLVWLEVVTAVASNPTQLTVVVGGYLAATVVGSGLLGRATWRRQFDPLSGVFDLYGRLAPIRRTDDGLELRAPAAALVETAADATTRASEVGFVVALLWVTTFDGFVTTPAWQSLAAPVVRAGLPAELAYFGALLGGYALFFGGFWAAAKRVRVSARTALSAPRIAAAFAPALVPVAAGSHFAHYVPYFLTRLPSLVVVALNPLSPPTALPVLALPGWMGWVGPLAVLAGHLLAVWTVRARAFALFGDRLRPRSRYLFLVVLVLYTITGLWLLALPVVDVPFV